MPLVLKRLKEAGLLNEDAPTVTGRTIGEHAAGGRARPPGSGSCARSGNRSNRPAASRSCAATSLPTAAWSSSPATSVASTPVRRGCSTARRRRWRRCSPHEIVEGDVVVIRNEGPAGRPGHARDAGGHRGDRRRGAGGDGRADHRRALLRAPPTASWSPTSPPRRPGAARSARSPTAIEITIDVDERRIDVALSEEQIAERLRGLRARRRAPTSTSRWRSRSTPSSSAAPPRAPSRAERPARGREAGQEGRGGEIGRDEGRLEGRDRAARRGSRPARRGRADPARLRLDLAAVRSLGERPGAVPRGASARRPCAATSPTCRSSGAAPSTTARKLAALRALFQASASTGRSPRTRPSWCPRRGAPSHLPRVLSAREAGRLLDGDPRHRPAGAARPGAVRAGLLVRAASRGDRLADDRRRRPRRRAAAGRGQGPQDPARARRRARPGGRARYLERGRARPRRARRLAGRRSAPVPQQERPAARHQRRAAAAAKRGPRGPGVGGGCLAPRPPAQLRHPPARRRRGPAQHPGDARPRERVEHPDLHSGRVRPAQSAYARSHPRA